MQIDTTNWIKVSGRAVVPHLGRALLVRDASFETAEGVAYGAMFIGDTLLEPGSVLGTLREARVGKSQTKRRYALRLGGDDHIHDEMSVDNPIAVEALELWCEQVLKLPGKVKLLARAVGGPLEWFVKVG